MKTRKALGVFSGSEKARFEECAREKGLPLEDTVLAMAVSELELDPDASNLKSALEALEGTTAEVFRFTRLRHSEAL